MPLFALVVCISAWGCGVKTGSVSGKVTVKGQTMGKGTVVYLEQTTGQTYQSDITPEGAYRIDKIPIGEYKIAVVTPHGTGQGYGGMGGKGAAVTAPPKGMGPPPGATLPGGVDASAYYGGGDASKFPKINPIFSTHDKSPLKFTIIGGEAQTKDLELN